MLKRIIFTMEKGVCLALNQDKPKWTFSKKCQKVDDYQHFVWLYLKGLENAPEQKAPVIKKDTIPRRVSRLLWEIYSHWPTNPIPLYSEVNIGLEMLNGNLI